MHYYQHHIGDFIKATSRLSDAHSMAYLRMIWLYYEQECPLPDNTAVIALKVGAEPEVVSLILEAFFKRDGDVWRHTRCDTEIAEYRAICERNRTNGKAGGRPKKTQSVSSGNPDETETKPHRNPNHKPLTNIPPISPKGVEQRFEDFWKAYPRKVGKDAAKRSFLKRKPDDDMLQQMLQAIATQSRTEQWTREGGQFIPHPSTWLSQGRWMDGEQATVTNTLGVHFV